MSFRSSVLFFPETQLCLFIKLTTVCANIKRTSEKKLTFFEKNCFFFQRFSDFSKGTCQKTFFLQVPFW